MLQEILIFLGLSIDGFIAMMNKGAQLRNMHLKNMLVYALEFSCIVTTMFMIGFVSSKPLVMNIARARIEITIASLIVLLIGALLITKSFLNKGFEEKLDDSFNWKSLAKIAFMTSIDSFL